MKMRFNTTSIDVFYDPHAQLQPAIQQEGLAKMLPMDLAQE
jgi:hypothetical protein